MKSIKKLVVSFAALLAVSVLAGCEKPTTSSAIPGDSSNSEIINSSNVTSESSQNGGDQSSSNNTGNTSQNTGNSSSSQAASSNNGGSSSNKPVEGDENWVDYVSSPAVRLPLDYKGRDFYKDGIGEVTLRTVIDGDTAHFDPVVKTTSSLTIKSRYYGIDTPESTGRIQQWGQPASDFNKSRLNKAKENGTIVVSTAQEGYGKPQYDSTGERFVSLIWINETKKNANYDELYLLNLAIVQEGYSWVKNVQDMPNYADTFYAAERQAQAYKLHLFSGEDDGVTPTGDYINTSLLDLKVATENYIKDKNYQSPLNNQKVRVRGTVAGYSNGTMYLQSHFSEEDSEEIRGEGKGIAGGEYASINIFCGMSSVPTKYRKINTFIQLCVFAKYSENFGFQLTGAEGHFPIVASEAEEDDCQILLKAEENVDEQQLHIAEYTPARLSQIASAGDFECLNCAIKLTEPVECNKVYVNTAGDEFTLYFKNCSFNAYLTFTYAGDPDKPYEFWNTEAQFKGKKFLLSGIYTYHQTQSGNTTYQIIFNNASDLQWVKESA